ncbi:MAG: hypothetical protein U5K99_10630 [Anaerolineales bacterium]|nr:hypothetical protein [Anaerolineales bacterium]
MIEKKSWTGGARLDLFNATWPFATLSVTEEILELSTFKTKLIFRPDQIEKIESIGLIPFVGKGIQIHHKLDPLTNPTKVIFWHLSKDTKWLVETLQQWGFGTAC